MLFHVHGLFLICASTTQCRPEVFKSMVMGDSTGSLERESSQQEENELESSDDDGLPPLEANTNRIRPFELHEETDSGSDSDSDS